jgi:predicted O-methyltransferase YrrM
MDDTSTAVGTLNKRDSKFRRLTTAECLRLPETFFPEDVCVGDEKLLLNTGCMVIDLRQDWVKPWFASGGFRFETDCWLQENGEWKSILLPEDWLMSWDAQTKFGAKVAATTKIRLIHYGETGYANRYPRVANNAILGWLNDDDAQVLYALARDQEVLEIGAYKGLSTCVMAASARHVTTIDTFDGRDTPNPCDTWGAFNNNLEKAEVGHKVTAHVGRSDDVLARLSHQGRRFDLAFIDGAHDYENVRSDIEGVFRVLKSGGTIVFHDYTEKSYPGVKQAVDELLTPGSWKATKVGSLAVMKNIPAPLPAELEQYCVPAVETVEV